MVTFLIVNQDRILEFRRHIFKNKIFFSAIRIPDLLSAVGIQLDYNFNPLVSLVQNILNVVNDHKVNNATIFINFIHKKKK